MKIGIMGGTFDPVHNGHLMLGEYACRMYCLDEVWFMPNGNPPHKRPDTIKSDAWDRARMVALAIAGRPEFRLERYEVDKKEVSCTYGTLEYFREVYREDEFYFIIGADSLFAIESWVHPERIFPNCTILAAYRDDMDTQEIMYEKIDELREKFHARIELLSTPLFPVSSSDLRYRIRKGLSVKGLLPEKVEQFIADRGLYKDERYEPQDQQNTQKTEKVSGSVKV